MNQNGGNKTHLQIDSTGSYPGHSLITVDTRINQTQEMKPAVLSIISYELMTLGVNYVHTHYTLNNEVTTYSGKFILSSKGVSRFVSGVISKLGIISCWIW